MVGVRVGVGARGTTAGRVADGSCMETTMQVGADV